MYTENGVILFFMWHVYRKGLVYRKGMLIEGKRVLLIFIRHVYSEVALAHLHRAYLNDGL